MLILLVIASGLFCQVLTASSSVLPASTSAKPQGFSARSFDADDEVDEFDSQAQTHIAYRQRQQPLYDYSQSEEVEQEEPPRQVYQNRNYKQQNNYLKVNEKARPVSEEETEEVEEEEEPDRLAMLLTKSTFNCNSKNSGYYADESLNCEIFHYCQENQRHSWICPEGFTFHQIHLICMPPSHDNICEQSSKYHIVNDYLYKPINLQEHQSKPNITLRYSNRYFPENYYDRYDNEDEEDVPRQRPHQQQRQPLQVGFRSQQLSSQQTTTEYTPHVQQKPQQQQYQQTRQPIQQVRHQQIPTQAPHITPVYRRPAQTTTTSQPPITQHRTPTYAPYISPTPYRFYTGAPQLSQQQVYRTPEEINISLQQRRPQLFVATSTPRYYEDDYLYERRK